MNLITTYSLHSGLAIDKPIIVEDYVPLAADRYITFHAGGGQNSNFPSKLYPYFHYVILLLKQAGLKEKVVQLGEANELLVPGVDIDMRGKTRMRQVFYLVKRAALHFGNCSFPGHVAGAYDIPQVALYGPTTKANHAPHWYNPKSIFIESHRDGRKCSFSAVEHERTIDMIPPEDVANAILSLLGYPPVTLKTVHMGKLAAQSIVDYIPDFVLNPQTFPGLIPLIRLDYHFNEDNAFNLLSQRKCAIISNRELNLNLLAQLKPNLHQISYEVTATSNPTYLRTLIKVGLPLRFYSKLRDRELAELRFNFLDVGNVLEQRDNDKKVEGAAKVRSSKVVLSQGKAYTSRGHQLLDLPVGEEGASDFIEHPMFYSDLDYQWLYN